MKPQMFVIYFTANFTGKKNILELSKLLFPCAERQDGREDYQPDRTESFGMNSEENTLIAFGRRGKQFGREYRKEKKEVEGESSSSIGFRGNHSDKE